MRHSVDGRQLNRTSAHRRAMRRNLVQSLFQHGEIRTTITKAREIRRMADRLVTLAIAGDLRARQRAIAMLGDRAIIPEANQEEYDRMTDARRAKVLRSRSGRRYRKTTTKPGIAFTADSVINRLFSEIGPKMKRRNEGKGNTGGYTRMIKLADRRIGDGTQLALVRLVAEDDIKRPKLADKTERKRKARVRYAFYAGKEVPTRGPKKAAAPKKAAKPKAQ